MYRRKTDTTNAGSYRVDHKGDNTGIWFCAIHTVDIGMKGPNEIENISRRSEFRWAAAAVGLDHERGAVRDCAAALFIPWSEAPPAGRAHRCRTNPDSKIL
jgi:hypothetical protein